MIATSRQHFHSIAEARQRYQHGRGDEDNLVVIVAVLFNRPAIGCCEEVLGVRGAYEDGLDNTTALEALSDVDMSF